MGFAQDLAAGMQIGNAIADAWTGREDRQIARDLARAQADNAMQVARGNRLANDATEKQQQVQSAINTLVGQNAMDEQAVDNKFFDFQYSKMIDTVTKNLAEGNQTGNYSALVDTLSDPQNINLFQAKNPNIPLMNFGNINDANPDKLKETVDAVYHLRKAEEAKANGKQYVPDGKGPSKKEMENIVSSLIMYNDPNTGEQQIVPADMLVKMAAPGLQEQAKTQQKRMRDINKLMEIVGGNHEMLGATLNAMDANENAKRKEAVELNIKQTEANTNAMNAQTKLMDQLLKAEKFEDFVAIRDQVIKANGGPEGIKTISETSVTAKTDKDKPQQDLTLKDASNRSVAQNISFFMQGFENINSDGSKTFVNTVDKLPIETVDDATMYIQSLFNTLRYSKDLQDMTAGERSKSISSAMNSVINPLLDKFVDDPVAISKIAQAARTLGISGFEVSKENEKFLQVADINSLVSSNIDSIRNEIGFIDRKLAPFKDLLGSFNSLDDEQRTNLNAAVTSYNALIITYRDMFRVGALGQSKQEAAENPFSTKFWTDNKLLGVVESANAINKQRLNGIIARGNPYERALAKAQLKQINEVEQIIKEKKIVDETFANGGEAWDMTNRDMGQVSPRELAAKAGDLGPILGRIDGQYFLFTNRNGILHQVPIPANMKSSLKLKNP